MPKNKTNPTIDAYLRKAKKWQWEMTKLRAIALGCGLTEELKWGKPCYTFQESNIVLIIGFKNYCALLLCKGALLKDPKRILITAGENTQAARQIRFTDIREIVRIEVTLKAYLREAIAAEKAGLKVQYKKSSAFAIPEELQKKLDEHSAFKAAFQSLTPGRQRAYVIHFSAAKQSQTRVSRIEKCLPQILEGKGLHDEYRSMKK
jgi:uncharacterized protein YdeI (YjbR/CyaY-like superfamily)